MVVEFTPADAAVDFTPQQQDAIRYKRVDACVVAGPGSGKTTVLVERYRELIDFHHFEPRQILAITFTEKAAANMKAKVAEKFRHDEMRLRELESAWVSTIHGFCARLLRENAIAAGINPRFTVLDARESDDLQYECVSLALDELVAERRDPAAGTCASSLEAQGPTDAALNTGGTRPFSRDPAAGTCASSLEDALSLIRILQAPSKIAGDLKNAYDAIRSAGKSVEEVRSMPSPVQAECPENLACRLVQLLNQWPRKLTDLQAEERAGLLAWAPLLAVADTTDLDSLRAFLKSRPINLRRVPNDAKPALEALREDLAMLITAAVDAHTAPFREMVFQVLARFDALYNERKTLAGALDFNDLERRSIGLLRRNTVVAERVRTQFRQIMLDEFQDINQQQAELIRLIRGENVFFAVGDVNQSIYGFRHARPDIFHDYRREIEDSAKHYTELLDNFRSRPDILRCVEGLLNSAEGIESRQLIAGAAFSAKPEPSVEILRVFDEDRDEGCTREARWMAHRILELRDTLRAAPDFRDYAVLCRNGDSMRPILAEFDRLRIPYVCGRRQSFLLAREGLDITALLHVVANPRDAIALATVLRSPLVGIGDEALLRVRLLGGSVTGGLNLLTFDGTGLAEFSEDDARKIERFGADLKRWRADQQFVLLDVLIVRMLNDCGFIWTPGDTVGDNVEAFLHLARTRGAGRTLLQFLRELESMEGAISGESDLSDDDQGNCVQVMTAHAAKGLEFPVTIIAAADKGTQRSSASVTFTPENGLGIKWNDPSNKDGLKDSWALANSECLKQREKEEAHRLLYVAMTRAEEHLILSYSTGKRRPENWARELDEFFGLGQRIPSGRPETIASAGFAATVLMTDTDPPPPNVLAAARRNTPEVFVLSLPEIEDQHETAVNVTSLAVFANCPRKYYLQRYIGWNGSRFARFDPEEVPAESDSEVSAAELGSFVHDVLAGKPGPHPPEALELSKVFLESDLGRRAASASRSAREWDFIADIAQGPPNAAPNIGGTRPFSRDSAAITCARSLEAQGPPDAAPNTGGTRPFSRDSAAITCASSLEDGILVRGSIDLWFEESGEIYVVDYKTDSITAAEVPDRAAKYSPQLALYSVAIWRAFGTRPAGAYLHFLRPNVVSEVTVDDAALENARELIARLRDAQNHLRFDLNEGAHCQTCSFYGSMCPAGK